jgi:hypothetical protein
MNPSDGSKFSEEQTTRSPVTAAAALDVPLMTGSMLAIVPQGVVHA